MKALLSLVVMAVLGAFIYYLLFPPEPDSTSTPQISLATRREAYCFDKVRQVGMGLIVYAMDSDGKFPEQSVWTSATERFVKYDKAFRCPSLPEGAFGYAFNSALSRVAMPTSPEKTVLTFESTKTEKNASDPFASFPTPGRHSGRGNLAYADGHVKSVTP